MLEQGVMHVSISPWASPLVMVDKKDGGIRLCVDYRKVNKVSKFPMPVQDILDEVGPAKFISTLNWLKAIGRYQWLPIPKRLLHFQPHMACLNSW